MRSLCNLKENGLTTYKIPQVLQKKDFTGILAKSSCCQAIPDTVPKMSSSLKYHKSAKSALPTHMRRCPFLSQFHFNFDTVSKLILYINKTALNRSEGTNELWAFTINPGHLCQGGQDDSERLRMQKKKKRIMETENLSEPRPASSQRLQSR